MKLLVTGDREWRDSMVIHDVLSQFPAGTVLVHGDCRGVDRIASSIDKQFGFDVRAYPARWRQYGAAAGPLRNQQMLDEENTAGDEIDLCLIFHDDLEHSKGTKDMVVRADNAGVNTRRYFSRVAQPHPL